MTRQYGRVAIVDLKDGATSTMDVEQDVCKKFIGGAGLAAWLYDRLAGTAAAPLAAANPFIALTGPLTGTSVMLSGRHSFAGRSPQTGMWGEASVGGNWGYELRKTPFDGVVLKERADKPVYVFIEDEAVHIRDAAHLWGKDTFETDELLKKELGAKIQTCVIGPAGENLVAFAGLFTDGVHARTAARSGLGALLGSKNVKAIAVKGSGKAPVLEGEALKASVKAMIPDFTGRTKGMSEFGTPGLVAPCESIGDLPINNWRQGKWTENAAKISGQVLKEKYLKKKFFCYGCVVGCGRTVGGVLGEKVEETGGPEYETLALLGANCLIDDMDAILRLNELCNRLGVDTIDAGACVSFCLELKEKGIIGSKELGGIQLEWGNGPAAEELIAMIVERQGFGDVLAKGINAAADEIGGLAPEYAMASNNMALPGHDPRAYASLTLGYSTSTRGPCHVDGFTHIFERACTFPEVGIPEVMNRFTSEGKPEMVKQSQQIMQVWNSLALCKFSIFGGVRFSDVCEWLKQTVGWELTLSDLQAAGERIFNLKRKLNVAWGISRKNDTLPLRVLTRRNSDGGAGDHLPPFNIMLADYYKLRGWSEEGIPTRETLHRLGIE